MLTSRFGNERDLYYQNTPDDLIGINNVTWSELINLVDQYCNSSVVGPSSTNGTNNMTQPDFL